MTHHHEGAAIKAAREARGWSQRQLAQHAGIGQRTLGRIERGEVEETPKLRRVQAYLRIGPYQTNEPDGSNNYDPPLSQATAGELGAEVMQRLLMLDRLLAEHGPPGSGSGNVRATLAKPGVVTLTDEALDQGAHQDSRERGRESTAG